MPVRVAEVETASAVSLIDFHILERTRSAAIRNAFGADAADNAIEVRFAYLERIVMTLEAGRVVEIQGQRFVDPQRCEVRNWPFIGEAENSGQEPRGMFLVARRDD